MKMKGHAFQLKAQKYKREVMMQQFSHAKVHKVEIFKKPR
uniref:Uncharacterized protein n=1 Tax=Arundo donax TaxID=35708 RepID=A0A0A9GNR5_ARUDO